MPRAPIRLVLLAACVAAALVLPVPGLASGGASAPVPSLEPAKTEALWRKLTHRAPFRLLQAQQACRPLRAVFYASGDWLRLATMLAAKASPCAQYSISVPPVVADKTRQRPGQAERIRALGSSFHALAEIHLTTWQKWVASTGSTWYQAGVDARRKMAAAGFDVAAGDTWALNEVNSAMRRGDGVTRTNLREFLRGLYDAGGEGPPAKGVVFVVGIGQTVPAVATYKARTQEWLQDATFWSEMNAYVSDWSQEVYADVRSYAAPGTSTVGRRDALVDYLRHADLLAGAGGAASGTANAFFQNAASPLGNAAFQWGFGFGYTLVEPDLMRHFVSAQVYALRNFGVRSGRPADRWGFAWSPRNSGSYPAEEWAAMSGSVLDRLATAIRDSALDVPSDPGSRACGPAGQNRWCAGDLDGARLAVNWRTFRAWSPTTLAFVSTPPSVVAGAVSAPITVQAQVAGVAARPLAPVPTTVSSSSPSGMFSTSPTGPFTPTVAVELPGGAFGTAQVYYQDTSTGVATITASGPGVVSGLRSLAVTGGALTSLRLDPATATVPAGGTAVVNAIGRDQLGNEFPVTATWTLSPDAAGTIAPASGPTVTFTAGRAAGPAMLTATAVTPTGTFTASTSLTVTPPPPVRVAAVRYGVANRRLHVYVTVVDARGRRVNDASVTVALYRDEKVYARAAGTTVAGRMTFDRPASTGTYRTRVTRLVADGYTWDRATPANAFTKQPKPRPKPRPKR
jgi:hypothetical protein